MTHIYDFCALSFAGRLTKDPIFTTNKKGIPQAKITIARSKFFFKKGDNVDPNNKGSEITTFLPCYVYGEYLLEKLKKTRSGDWLLVKADFCPLKNADNDLTSVGFVIESINCIIPPKSRAGVQDTSAPFPTGAEPIRMATTDDDTPF